MSDITNGMLRELSDAELDAVAGGAQGLVAVDVHNVLNGADILTNFANNNNVQVGVGAAVAVLGAAAGGAQNNLHQIP